MGWTSGADAVDNALVHSRAFPGPARELAQRLLTALPMNANRLDHFFTVTVGGEDVIIPYRVYNPVPDPVPWVAFEDVMSRELLACFYSRHHDGFVRQRAARYLLRSERDFVVPFIAQLVGEYVVEIIEDVRRGLDLRPGSAAAERYGAFVRENPAFIELTSQRVTSYWSCYYRWRYPMKSPTLASGFEVYPGFEVIAALRAAGAHWPSAMEHGA